MNAPNTHTLSLFLSMHTHNYQQIINKFAEVLSRMGTAQAEGYVDYIYTSPSWNQHTGCGGGGFCKT